MGQIRVVQYYRQKGDRNIFSQCAEVLGNNWENSEFVWVLYMVGTAVVQWVRHCATNRKVTGLIPDSVIGIFH